MTTNSLDGSAAAPPDDRDHAAGFAMLGLAELVSIFGVWFGSWPTTFDVPASLGHALALFFVGAGIVGFYLAFQALTL